MNKKEFPLSLFAYADVFVIYDLKKDLCELLPMERIGIRTTEITKIFRLENFDKFGIHQPVTIQDKDHYYLHNLFRAIDNNALLSALKKEVCWEREETFISPSKLLVAFRHYPSLVTNTYKLLSECSIETDFHIDKTMQVYGASKEDDFIFYRK